MSLWICYVAMVGWCSEESPEVRVRVRVCRGLHPRIAENFVRLRAVALQHRLLPDQGVQVLSSDSIPITLGV